jgi:hypothetical protein
MKNTAKKRVQYVIAHYEQWPEGWYIRLSTVSGRTYAEARKKWEKIPDVVSRAELCRDKAGRVTVMLAQVACYDVPPLIRG